MWIYYYHADYVEIRNTLSLLLISFNHIFIFLEKPIEVKKICDPIKCGAPCKEVSPESPDECPKCVCEGKNESIKLINAIKYTH